jgi:hypothetical protein
MRMSIAAIALLLASPSADAAPKFVPAPVGGGEGVVIPANSPVEFQRMDKDDVARFSGQFVLSGTFSYGCEIECDPPLKDDRMTLAIVPDAGLAARLPHWKERNTDIKIYLTNEAKLVPAIATAAERSKLRAGKIEYVRGHVAVVVDSFRAAIECDSAAYSARFVKIASAPEKKSVKLSGNYGCG